MLDQVRKGYSQAVSISGNHPAKYADLASQGLIEWIPERRIKGVVVCWRAMLTDKGEALYLSQLPPYWW